MKSTLVIILCIISCCSQNDDGKELEKALSKNWEYEYFMAGGIWAPPTIFNDSTVVMTGDTYLRCFLIEEGFIKWQTQISNDLTLQSRFILKKNNYLFSTHVDDVRAWDIDNGEEIWRIEVPDDRGRLFASFSSVDDNAVYIAGNHQVKSIEILGGIKYNFKVKGSARSAIVNNNKLYCGSGWTESSPEGAKPKGRITCLDAETGDSLWAFNSVQGWFSNMAPIIEEGVVYCGTVEGPSDFYAIDAETGQQIWKSEGLSAYDAILVDDVLYVNSGGNVHAVDKSDGTKLWELITGYISTHPIAYYNGYIYHTASGILLIINAESGEIVHKMFSEDGTSFWYASTGGGKVFLQSAEHLYCYDPWDPED